MTKAEIVQLADYKKSNSARKLILLARWGYKNQETYFKAIKHVPGKKSPVKVAKSAPVKLKTKKK